MNQPSVNPFLGHFDAINADTASGWALNQNIPDQIPVVHILIDGQEVAQVQTSLPRPDVRNALGLPHDRVGFAFTIPDRFFDGEPHEIAVRFPNRAVVPFTDPADPTLRKTHATFTARIVPEYTSCVDGIRSGNLQGWVLQRERKQPWTGGCIVTASIDGARIAQVRADRYRGDVAAALGCDAACGFDIPVPQRFRGSSPRRFSIRVQPLDVELSGSPFTSSVADDALETSLVDIADTIDRLHKELAQLRTTVRRAIPQPGYNLGHYDRWARRYYPALRERTALLRAAEPLENPPLVSILCPAYKPLMIDFTAAVESVIAQTYTNWELIIVDDGAPSAAVSEKIAEYCASDTRIRVVTLKKNRGISGATNAAMDAVRGAWTVFFDHDDLLVDVAVETMMRAALRTGARMLYSDEDKIDQAGHYQAPNFKPDFNYRYLLGCNYICHLTMVDTALMREVGHLRSEYDGAQDHDFVLRVCEAIPHEQIVHVPEVLYHWRMTPNSTAVAIGNKTYAIEAGVRAVTDHLRRLKLKADVSSINGLTLYRVAWQNRRTPKVSIIIPFKDQIDTTRRCLETLLTNTSYKAFEIVLVNNWSVTMEADQFIAEARAIPNVRILDVEEPFNYSRLNNLAVASCKADFYLFMNNDVFVEKPEWLRALVNEGLSAPDIGAVGARLLYPNDTVQHAGVIVGPSGIGAHGHRGSSLGDYGYIGRILLPHEVTAVTAACMLIRADVFQAVGGFDEEHLRVAYNDVDLCLKVRTAGYRIIYAADVVAYHHESLSRGSDDTPEHESRFFAESQVMLERWGENPTFLRDPAYSRFLTVDQQPFFDLAAPETPRPRDPVTP